MSLFEFDSGKLVPAQFGTEVKQGLSAEILEAIRTQVLEVIEQPLFPVAWENSGQRENDAQGIHSLTALDCSGQIVSVEIISELNSITVVSALSRLGKISSYGWYDLASIYPGGPEAFQTGWKEFREAMPPNVKAGPRLFLVVDKIDPTVMSALGVLYHSGMELHQVSLRRMSNGRRFVEVQLLKPGQVRPNFYPGIITPRPAMQVTKSANDPQPVAENLGVKVLATEKPEVVKTESSVPQLAEENTLPVSPVIPVNGFNNANSGVSSHRRPSTIPSVPQLKQSTVPVAEDLEKQETLELGFNPAGLLAIAKTLKQNTVLLWRDPFGKIIEALLLENGSIDPGNGELTTDVSTALQYASGGQIVADSWQAFRIGDLQGPTLAEAIAEINQGHKRRSRRVSMRNRRHRYQRG